MLFEMLLPVVSAQNVNECGGPEGGPRLVSALMGNLPLNFWDCMDPAPSVRDRLRIFSRVCNFVCFSPMNLTGRYRLNNLGVRTDHAIADKDNPPLWQRR